jgi:hypothetical protein
MRVLVNDNGIKSVLCEACARAYVKRFNGRWPLPHETATVSRIQRGNSLRWRRMEVRLLPQSTEPCDFCEGPELASV